MAFSISEKIVKESKNMRLNDSVSTFKKKEKRVKRKISTFFYFENTIAQLGYLLHEQTNQNLGFKAKLEIYMRQHLVN